MILSNSKDYQSVPGVYSTILHCYNKQASCLKKRKNCEKIIFIMFINAVWHLDLWHGFFFFVYNNVFIQYFMRKQCECVRARAQLMPFIIIIIYWWNIYSKCVHSQFLLANGRKPDFSYHCLGKQRHEVGTSSLVNVKCWTSQVVLCFFYFNRT